ncbi:hypothetical protein ACGFW5_13235 [Streptomyces sp. NPDC048416]|uniref:hypothetical protein n=1 Tax=Streptomyces sp. NPDC048416 TaxID=3365546 RepID=UPI00371F67F0
MQSAPHAPAEEPASAVPAGSAVSPAPTGPPVSSAPAGPPAAPVFAATDDPGAYAAAVEDFLGAASSGPVPVLTGGRADVLASVERSASLYAAVSRPAPHARGVLLGADALPAGLAELITPLATTWLDEAELTEALFDADHGEHALLVAGTYEHFTLAPLWRTLLAAQRHHGIQATFLTGRDAVSLAWFTAKQYAQVAPDVVALGLFTSTDRPAAPAGVLLRDERGVESEDVKAEVLGTPWRRILFQGHGKDDSINLADFTVCGLNEAAPRSPGLLGPSCAYGPTCYKPMDKLIQLREVRAAEVVLSSCNNAPFADAATYDPKYQLMLNAIDGTAKDVVAAITVHDSDRPENTAWMDAVLAGAPSVTALNESIATAQPFPAYLHFGMAPDTGTAPARPSSAPDPLLLTASARLTAYLAGGLLPGSNRLRPRLVKLAGKVEQQVTRRAVAAQDAAQARRVLLDDLQSLDHTIAQQLGEEPENELADYPAHFGDRSTADPDSVREVLCQCGRPAQLYIKRALVPTALDTECVICPRCGDVSFRLPDSPALSVHAEDDVSQGGTLRVRVAVRGSRSGPVRVGLFVPGYLRANCEVSPRLRKIRATADGEREADFTLTVQPGTPPQAYYLTAFAVQDLALTTARRHFGVVPAETPRPM